LGLLDFNRSAGIEKFSVSRDATPIVVVVLAGYNPRSEALDTILDEIKDFAALGAPFTLRFFVASFAGYALHEACMVTLEDFRELVRRLRADGSRLGE
jgi:hypothetical protein